MAPDNSFLPLLLSCAIQFAFALDPAREFGEPFVKSYQVHHPP